MRGYKSNTGKGIPWWKVTVPGGLEKTETAAWRFFDSTERGSKPLHIHSQICHKTFSTMENSILKSILVYDLLATLFLFAEKCTQMCPLSSNEYTGELDTSRAVVTYVCT